MRDKILAELNKKYLGLSKKVLELVANKRAVKVTEDSQIEGVIAALDNLPLSLKEFAEFVQKEGDTWVTEALNKNPPKDSGDNDPAEPEKDKPKTGDDALLKRMDDLTKMVQGVLQKDTQSHSRRNSTRS